MRMTSDPHGEGKFIVLVLDFKQEQLNCLSLLFQSKPYLRDQKAPTTLPLHNPSFKIKQHEGRRGGSVREASDS